MEEYKKAQKFKKNNYDEYIMALTASADEGWEDAIRELDIEETNNFPRYSLQNYNVTKKFYKNRSGLYSQFALAAYYQHYKRKYDKAKNIYENLVEKGLSEAMNALGFMYQTGKGVVLDSKVAVKYYRMSIKAGGIRGYNNLGFMYQKGLGVEQNYGKADKYYKLAISKGNKHGLDNLCYMYKNFYCPEYNEVLEYFLQINQKDRLKDVFSFDTLLDVVLKFKKENEEMKNHILASPEGPLYFEALENWKKDTNFKKTD